jgi:hypothetical protein
LRHAPYFQHLADKYQEKANFLCVYITEAHAADEWPIGPTISFCSQPKSIEERCDLANKFVTENNIRFEVVVDSMENSFEKMFAAWPIRFYVIKNGELVFKAEPNLKDYAYDPTELSRWLKNL